MPHVTISRRFRAQGHVLAVVDDHADAVAAVRDLTELGIEPNRIVVLRGAAGVERLDATGRPGLRARAAQLVSFTMVDQMPDMIVYEAALRDGRTVLAIPAASEEGRRGIVERLRARRAHFLNFFGRFATEEIDLWRGPELDIAGYLRR